MKNDTAIVFTATFIGVITAVITFNQLVTHNILPSKAPKLAKLEVEPIKAVAATKEEAFPTVESVPSESLQDIVSDVLSGSKGKYSVAIKHLKTGETYFKDENDSYESASLYKLWVMGETYDQIREGKLKEDDALSADVTALNKQFNIASESAERSEGSVSFSVSSALHQMITISHNYAALLLSSKVKLANVKAYLADNKLEHSKTGSPPKTTAADTLFFFEKLYKGELAEQEYTAKMLDLLKKQKLNNKLPKYMPKDTVIAHKTGELGGVTHDAGIVYTPQGEYIIVVLSDSNAPKGAEERIAKISKGVYTYFTSK